jgi:hypothetical protein
MSPILPGESRNGFRKFTAASMRRSMLSSVPVVVSNVAKDGASRPNVAVCVIGAAMAPAADVARAAMTMAPRSDRWEND